MRITLLLGLVALAVPSNGRAETYFIGGVGSQAGVLHSCFPNFVTYALGGASPSAIAARINEELAKNPSATAKIVGHSSGAAVAEEVAEHVNKKYVERIELVELDGLGSHSMEHSLPHSACWYSANGRSLSRNAGAMVQCRNPHRLSNSTCQTQWCLHFSLVNPRAPAGLSGGNFRSEGYAGCGGGLPW